MSKEPTKEELAAEAKKIDDAKKKRDAKDAEPEPVEPIVIQIEDTENKGQDEVIKQMAAKIETLEARVTESDNKTEEAKKQVLLDRLKVAKYNPDDFKELPYDSLLITVKALSNKDGRIVIPRVDDSKKDDKDKSGMPKIEMTDLKTGETYDFYERRLNLNKEAKK